MKIYSGENIRNVAIVGHGKAGKTTLVSAMLSTAGATARLGRVDDGTSTTDYDEEEIARKMSIAASAAYVEWDKTKINILLLTYDEITHRSKGVKYCRHYVISANNLLVFEQWMTEKNPKNVFCWEQNVFNIKR